MSSKSSNDIYREIEIKSDQTFYDLHDIIQQSIQFDGTKDSSFFMSNDHWFKGEEISLQPKTTRQGTPTKLMRKSALLKYILDPHQKIYYTVDGDSPWAFHLELVRILPAAEITAVYPKIKKIVGDAPRQYVSTIAPPIDPGELIVEVDEAELAEVADEKDIDAAPDEFDAEDTSKLEGEVGEDEELDDVEMSGDEEMEEEI